MSKLLIEHDTLVSVADGIRGLHNDQQTLAISDMIEQLGATTSLANAKFSSKAGLLNNSPQIITSSGTTIKAGSRFITISLPNLPSQILDPYIIFAGALVPNKYPTVYNYSQSPRYSATEAPALSSAYATVTNLMCNYSTVEEFSLPGGGKRYVVKRTATNNTNARITYSMVPYRTSMDSGFTTTEQEVVPAIFYYVFVIGPTSVSISSPTAS